MFVFINKQHWIKSLQTFRKRRTRSEAEVCPPLRWAGTRAETLGCRCTEHCCRISPQPCCLGSPHQRRKALYGKSLQNDMLIVEYFPLPEKQNKTKTFFCVGSWNYIRNVQQTHSDNLPAPGQSVEDVELAVALILPQATINKDWFRVRVKGSGVPSSAGWHGSGGRGVHGEPEVVVWEQVIKGKHGVFDQLCAQTALRLSSYWLLICSQQADGHHR